MLKYIARDKPGAAVTWVEKIEAKCLLLASHPEIGELRSQLGSDVRCNFVGRYVIFHRKHGDTVKFCESSQVIVTSRNSEVV